LNRWTVLATALSIALVGSLAVAVQAERAPALAAATAGGERSTITPVLSARRVPELVAAPVADRRLVAHLNDLLAQAPATSCLTVAVSGRVVFSSNPTMPLVPASVEKLTTAEAALSLLGPSSVFTTSIKGAAAQDGVVDGNLWLVGGGDPLLMTDPYVAHFKHQPVTHTSLEALADQVVAAGVHEVHGSIQGDESRYDQVRYNPAWPARFATEAEVGPLSSLMVNDGLTQFPPTYNASTPKETPAADPGVEAANQLTQLLDARGVVIDGPPGASTAPADAPEITKIESQPLDQIVNAMTLESDNDTAELLTKELGLHASGAGTTLNGVAAIRQTLQQRNLPIDGTAQVDGSGLASQDQETCALIQALLDAEGPGSTLANGLPVAGQTGTLDVRFLGTPVVGRLRAKTGTLNQATALAGYLQTSHGAQMSFAFIMNVPDPQKITTDQVGLEDQLGTILDQYPETPDVSALGPKSG
jgi:D-alanyl-D-alanine carboxypeptidase/D-alanyl-D-alanine-endopeptidase (penicillin-binding protein 4)